MRLNLKTSESLKISGATHVRINFELSDEINLETRFAVDKDGRNDWAIEE